MQEHLGLDAHHHVCHAYALEAAAQLTPGGDYLGALSLLPHMAEFQFLAQAVEYTAGQKEARLSIIASSMVAAGQGLFGDVHTTSRTQGSNLMINPLMSMYWCFQVDGLARRCLYLDQIKNTRSRGEITHSGHSGVSRQPYSPALAKTPLLVSGVSRQLGQSLAQLLLDVAQALNGAIFSIAGLTQVAVGIPHVPMGSVHA